MLFTALGGTGVQWAGRGGCSVPNSHLSSFSLGHSSFTKLATKAALVEVISFLKVEAFPGWAASVGAWVNCCLEEQSGKVGSFAVCSITSDCGQEYKATNNTKKQRSLAKEKRTGLLYVMNKVIRHYAQFFILLEIKTIGLSTNAYTQSQQYLQFSEHKQRAM